MKTSKKAAKKAQVVQVPEVFNRAGFDSLHGASVIAVNHRAIGAQDMPPVNQMNLKALVRVCVKRNFDYPAIVGAILKHYQATADRSESQRVLKMETPRKYAELRAKKVLGDILKEPFAIAQLGKVLTPAAFIGRK